MMRKSFDEKGIALVVFVGLVTIVLSVLGASLYIYDQQNNKGSNTNSNSVATPAESTPPQSNKTNATALRGTFQGVGTKTGSGSVTLNKNADGSYSVLLGEDFQVQQGPDLYVSFSNDGAYEEGTNFAELKSLTGAQEYIVPTEINVADYSQVMIWCREFNTPFVVATLN